MNLVATRRLIAAFLAFLLCTATNGQPAGLPLSYVSDPENCLSCHRFRGLSRLDLQTGEVRLFSCSLEYYAYQQGPHSRLRCTSCHKREEVAVIPHRVETPVNCTQACHIQTGTGVAVDFSHAPVAQKIEASAHSSSALAGLKLPVPLLRPGQSDCLYCHDEPVFREPLDQAIRVRAGNSEARCDTCHAQTLPLDADYFTRHVLSRLQPARSVRPMAQTCSVCHSDPDMIQQFGTHDVVASYLHSFHGKASLLGSTETATCIDCHRSTAGDVHSMLAASEPQSSVNPARLATTCRTTECHPAAPPAMTVAAVHLDLNPHERTPEYYLAAAFVLLTAGVMVVYFILLILEMLNTVLGRHDPDHHRLCGIARKLQAIPEARRQLARMSPHERIQHWALVLFFGLLVLTGMPLKFAEADWATSIISFLGNVTIARWVHRIAGVALFVAFGYHIVYLLIALGRRYRAARQRDPATTLWKVLISAPMVVTPPDVKQFGQLFAFLLFLRRRRPDFPHYNFMQKFEYWAVFWGTPVLGASGLVLWKASWVTEFLSGRVLNFAFIIHTLEAYLAFLHVAVVHLISVVLAPVVFPMSLGTFSGQAPAGELAEGHRGELLELAQKHGVSVEPAAHHRSGIRYWLTETVKRTYSAALIAGTAWVGFVAMRFLLAMLFTRQEAPIAVRDIPKRLDVPTLMAAAQLEAKDDDPHSTRMRGPLAHYHQLPPMPAVMLQTNCTTSGCHAPLPHGKRMEVRAFLNMHTTFADCMVCHARTPSQDLSVRWSGHADGSSAVPAVLQIAKVLERPALDQLADRQDLQAELAHLLQLAIEETRGNPELRSWLLRLNTVAPDNELWLALMEDMRAGIGLHVHGEYDSMLRLFAGGHPLAETKQQLDAIRQFVDKRLDPTDPQRQALLDTIHGDVRPTGLTCMTCHAPDSTFFDFRKLGYPESRATALTHSATIKQIMAIEAGQTFHLPGFLGNDDHR